MFKLLLASLILFNSAQATDIKEYFKKFEAKYKEPFGLNMLQTSTKRIPFKNCRNCGFIFLSAFRSDTAKTLLNEHGMYTGNLFATNYYELRAEFLKGDKNAANLSKSDNLNKLAEVSKTNPAVFQRAKQMVQNWNLEKLYILKNPSSRLAKSFTERGIGGAEYELKYGQRFVNYYIDAVETNLDLLPLIKLVNSSSLVTSSNFTKIRNRATNLYETYRSSGSKGGVLSKNQLREIKDIRDSIHNQLTPTVLTQIDAYMKKTKSYQGHAELKEIKALIKSYFARGVADINHIAKKGKIAVSGLKAINVENPKLKDLSEYANELVKNRKNMMSGTVKLQNKYIHLAYTSTAASFLSEKTKRYISKNRINASNIKELTVIGLQVLHAQGFVNDLNYGSLDSKELADFDNYEELVDNLLVEAVVNLKNAYSPYVKKWSEVDSRMEGIVDDSIRSSSINLFEQILEKMD